MAEQPDDPFRPPDSEAPSLELDLPARPAKRPDAEADRADSPVLVVPQKRAPTKYRAPRASWIMVATLALAAVGFATLSGLTWQKLMKAKLPDIGLPQKATEYDELSKDDAVLIDIDVTPKEARLVLDGNPLPSNPVRLQRDDQVHRVTGTAPGFEPATYSFLADKAKTLRLKLTRSLPSAKPTPSAKPPKAASR